MSAYSIHLVVQFSVRIYHRVHTQYDDTLTSSENNIIAVVVGCHSLAFEYVK